jgi:hypothetical protein
MSTKSRARSPGRLMNGEWDAHIGYVTLSQPHLVDGRSCGKFLAVRVCGGLGSLPLRAGLAAGLLPTPCHGGRWSCP